jgi:hypothetical protein
MRILLSVIICVIISNLAISQNVGIGTNTPETILHVAQTNTATDGIGGTFINLQNTTPLGASGSLTGLRFRMDGVITPVNTRYKGAIFFERTGSFGVGSLHFVTNNLGNNNSATMSDARMTINSAGEVGVGITNPTHKFHVSGGDFFLNSGTGSLRFGIDGSNQWRFATTGGGAHLLMISSPDGTTSNYRHYFEQGGDVGIGTGASAPGARLHVQTPNSEVIRVHGGNPYISMHDNTDGYIGYWWYNGADMVFGTNFGSDAKIMFRTNGSTRAYIHEDGRVVIGTSSSAPATGYLLNVDGKIISEEMKVQLSTGWPDYVFSDDYKLLSIDDLEKSIRQNKHLPNIPSAAQVTADKGFEVGDMNRRLLEKVEELTLYIIELNKKIKLLEEKVNK